MPRAGRSARSAAGSTGWRACRAPRRWPAPSTPASASRAARTRGSACPARTTRACHLLRTRSLRPYPTSGVFWGPVPARTGDVRSRIVDRFRYLSFLTDYGLEDGFVAACHGVSARIAPHADIIDVTHLIPPGDIRRGAAVLAQTVPYLPAAVHVAVVDPGVGTARRGIAVAAGDSVFIGPDNGLLSWAVTAAGGADRAFSLTNRDLWLTRVTPTFHGRDIFMPVAAHLAADAELATAGEEVSVAVNGGNAAERLGLPPGAQISITAIHQTIHP